MQAPRDDALKGVEYLPGGPMSLTVSLLNRQTLRTAETLLVAAGATLTGYVRERRGSPNRSSSSGRRRY